MRFLGVDVGSRRIGLAVSDPAGVLASPLRALHVSGPVGTGVGAVAREAAALQVDDEGLDGIVVGVPRALDGRAHAQTARVAEFVCQLRSRLALPVYEQDERLTSREAESRLAFTERDWRRRKSRLDAAAAAIILQDYLDCRPRKDGEAQVR